MEAIGSLSGQGRKALWLPFIAVILFLSHGSDAYARNRISGNQMSAHGSLKQIYEGQEEFKRACINDEDKDGIGEYGLLSELVRDEKSPFIDCFLGATNQDGVSFKSGYCFTLYLPEKTNAKERMYVVYAWPREHGKSGWLTYVMNHTGDIREVTIDLRRQGLAKPCVDMAFDGNPFEGAGIKPEWSPKGTIEDLSEWRELYRSLRIFALVVGILLIPFAVAFAVREWKASGIPSRFAWLPEIRGQIASALLGGVLAHVIFFRFVCDPKPEYWSLAIVMVAGVLSLNEAVEKASIGSLLGFISSVAFIQFDTNVWYIVIHKSDPSFDLNSIEIIPVACVQCLTIPASFLLSLAGFLRSILRPYKRIPPN